LCKLALQNYKYEIEVIWKRSQVTMQ
jgi:hypothetical protein